MNMINIDPSLPSAVPATAPAPSQAQTQLQTRPQTRPQAQIQAQIQAPADLGTLGFDLPLPTSLASLVHPASHTPDDAAAPRPASSKRPRRRTPVEPHHSDGHTSSDSDSELSENDHNRRHSPPALHPDHGNEARTASGSADRAKSSKRRSGTQSSKRKRRSFRAVNASDLRGSVDPLAVAHAVALIQSQRKSLWLRSS